MYAERAQETLAEPAKEGGGLGGGCGEQNTHPRPCALALWPAAVWAQGCHTSSSHRCLYCGPKPPPGHSAPVGLPPTAPGFSWAWLPPCPAGRPVKQGRHLLRPWCWNKRLRSLWGLGEGLGRSSQGEIPRQGQQTSTHRGPKIALAPVAPSCDSGQGAPSWWAQAQAGFTAAGRVAAGLLGVP